MSCLHLGAGCRSNKPWDCLHITQRIPHFSDRIARLTNANQFPLDKQCVDDFESLKTTTADASKQTVDELLPFVVGCGASDVTVSATLNQIRRPVAFMSSSLSQSELHYSSGEEATAIIEAVRKWRHFFAGHHFTLVTDQQSVSFMCDNRRRTKVKNNKIQCCPSLSYQIQYQLGKNNAPDTLRRAFCPTVSQYSLEAPHQGLCRPRVTCLLHFVRSKNLPFQLTT